MKSVLKLNPEATVSIWSEGVRRRTNSEKDDIADDGASASTHQYVCRHGVVQGQLNALPLLSINVFRTENRPRSLMFHDEQVFLCSCLARRGVEVFLIS
jgi:hypothetical protein